jgi:putative ABC transport system substrate-binding protein
MDRRAFIGTLAGSLLTVPLTTDAQQAKSVPRIGFLEAGAASANQHFLDAFQSGLRELGYVPGKTVIIDDRWAGGQAERFPKLLAELVTLRPDVIVVGSALGAKAAKAVVTSIPVVFVGVSDPIAAGVVESLAHPGANLTGLANNAGQGLISKGIQLLREIVPRASSVAILWNPAGAVDPKRRESEEATRALGMTASSFEVRDVGGFEEAFARMRKEHIDALIVITDPLTLQHRAAIVKLAAASRIPGVYEFVEFARAGGLIAYSANVPALFHRAAIYVDEILKGAKPADLPVEQPTTFTLIINVKTAKALGLTIPQSLLLRADEVIQ